MFLCILEYCSNMLMLNSVEIKYCKSTVIGVAKEVAAYLVCFVN